MKSLLAIVAATAFLALSSFAQEFSYANETLSHAISGAELLLKRSCSGTCSYCYGTGYTNCGSNACYNPSKGQSCCSAYAYSCDYGYYCAPGGLKSQCCTTSLSSSQCTSYINGNSSGLSDGAKIGIGVGIALIVFGIAMGVGVCLCMRRRRRNRGTAQTAAPGAWRMSGVNNIPEGQSMLNNNGWVPPPTLQNEGTPHGGWGPPPTQNGVTQGGWAAPQMQSPGNQGGWQPSPNMKAAEPYNGGPPMTGSYPTGQYNGGYGTPVAPAAELAENHPRYPSQPAPPYSQGPSTAQVYPQATQDERMRASEAYGGPGYVAH